MDAQVIAAMARWPDVPAVFGWLSLTESGQWRLHPGGDAIQHPDAPGEAITSPQILAFMGRNYTVDEQGQWYFQNGPQRVYVRLDAAPFTLQTATDTSSGRMKLCTHTGLDVHDVHALYLDETGRLYLATDQGPGLMAGRDLPALLDALESEEMPQRDAADALAHCLETGHTVMLLGRAIMGFPARPLPLHYCPCTALAERLRFRPLPAPVAGKKQPEPPAT